jgi:curved DNA-binding protein CbpA
MADYYSLLGLNSSATEAEIRAAYRSRAKVLHPDVNKSPDAHAKFVLLTNAYETLINPQKREKYNLKYQYNKSQNSYSAYDEWKKAQQAKAEEQARQKYYEFLRNREKFRKSRYYPLAKLVTSFMRYLAYGFGVTVIIICLFLMYHLHFMVFFLLIPFICGGVYLIKWTTDWYKETQRYF